jgi:hypothetical protein
MGASDVVDMNDGELRRDPFHGYSRIRERTPVVRAVMHGVDPVWLVTRYDDVKTVLSDPRFVVDPANVPGLEVENRSRQVQGVVGVPPEYLKYRMATMDAYDGADHARLRAPAATAYTARRIAQLRSSGAGITEKLLDRLPEAAKAGVVDLLADFAQPLASSMLSAAVGIPNADRPQWQKWYKGIWSAHEQKRADVWSGVISYLENLLERRRTERGPSSGADERGDLISALIGYREPGNSGPRANDPQLNDVEIISLVVLAGLTSQGAAHMIGDAVLALLTHPDQLALLRENPDLLPNTVHELIRWITPSPVAPNVRYPTEDVEIGGTLIRKGDAVAAVLIAANYDPRKFDEPHRLDITREPDRRPESHVAFGAGTHYCMGAALTRLTGELALKGLLRRYPGLTLAISPNDIEYKPMAFHNVLTALPVRL